MQLISKFNNEIRFLLCAIGNFSKHSWFVPLNFKTLLQIIDTFKKNLNEFGDKASKTWVDKGRWFYNKLLKMWLKYNEVKMYLRQNEGKI